MMQLYRILFFIKIIGLFQPKPSKMTSAQIRDSMKRSLILTVKVKGSRLSFNDEQSQ